MKYKTIIEVVTEAKDKDEALEITGEYLSGYIFSGVDMKCRTRPMHTYRNVAVSVVALSLILLVGIFSAVNLKHSQNAVSTISGVGAIQPTLKTQVAIDNNAAFKREWQDKQLKEAIKFIKK